MAAGGENSINVLNILTRTISFTDENAENVGVPCHISIMSQCSLSAGDCFCSSSMDLDHCCIVITCGK